MIDVASPETDAVALVVFGLDDAGKAHASRFDAASAELAEKAAGLMGMQSMKVDTDECRAAALALPLGRVFASGRAPFVPFVKSTVYERLCGLAGIPSQSPKAKVARPKRAAAKPSALDEDVTEPAGDDAGEPSDEAEGGADADADGLPLPADWQAIKVGSLVLAPETDRESWWPAIVLKAKGDDRWVLKWRDYDEPPTFVRKQRELGLLNPSSDQGL